jgi:hypothetical protein
MQDRNPFQPPGAPVEDSTSTPEPDSAPMQRPGTIDLAFWLIVGSAGLGLVSYVARGMQESAFMLGFVMVWLGGFAYLIRAGQNWARILFLVIFLLGLVGIVFTGAALLRFGAAYVAVMGLQSVMQGVAIWLAFSPPGSPWFRRSRRSGA